MVIINVSFKIYYLASEHAQYLLGEIAAHKQSESERQEALNEKLKTEKQKDQIKSGGWSVADVQLLTKALGVDFFIEIYNLKQVEGLH